MYQNQQSGTNNGGMVPEAKQALEAGDTRGYRCAYFWADLRCAR